MTSFTLTEPFEETGVWALPGDSTHMAGTLTYDPTEGITLKLFGALSPTGQEFARAQLRG